MKTLKQMSKKAKALGVIGATLAMSTASQAAITYSDTTNKFTGAVDLGAYYSGVEIAVAVVGVTLGISLFFAMLKKARA